MVLLKHNCLCKNKQEANMVMLSHTCSATWEKELMHSGGITSMPVRTHTHTLTYIMSQGWDKVTDKLLVAVIHMQAFLIDQCWIPAKTCPNCVCVSKCVCVKTKSKKVTDNDYIYMHNNFSIIFLNMTILGLNWGF